MIADGDVCNPSYSIKHQPGYNCCKAFKFYTVITYIVCNILCPIIDFEYLVCRPSAVVTAFILLSMPPINFFLILISIKV